MDLAGVHPTPLSAGVEPGLVQVSVGFGPQSLGSRILPGLYIVLKQAGADLCLINIKSQPPPALPVTD